MILFDQCYESCCHYVFDHDVILSINVRNDEVAVILSMILLSRCYQSCWCHDGFNHDAAIMLPMIILPMILCYEIMVRL